MPATTDPATTTDLDCLTVEDMARILAVSTTTIRRMEKAGDIPPALHLGRKTLYRWRRVAIENWLKDREEREEKKKAR